MILAVRDVEKEKENKTRMKKKCFLIFLLHFSLIDLSKAGAVFFHNEEKDLGKTVCTCKKSAKGGGGERRGRYVLPSTPLFFIQSSLS